jgi:glycerophosphoryl diester phosphodiesterase
MSYKIIGHRGDKASYTENTLAGFNSALETEGVDGLELDVVVSKDKKILISHDMHITDLSGKRQDIHTLTYDELLELSAKVNVNASLPGKPYPLLEDVLKLYSNQLNKKIILLEIKSLPSLEILPLSHTILIENIHMLLNTYQISDKCTIISFDYRLLEESKKQDKKRKVGLILHRNLMPLSSIAKELNLSLFVMERNWVTKEQIVEMQAKNVDIFTWTPNTQDEWIRLANLGIKGLITDKPKELNLFTKRRQK